MSSILTKFGGVPGTVESHGITIDGAGSVPATGAYGFWRVPFNCTIVEATLIANASGSCVIDVKKSNWTGFPPSSSICASAKPTLSSAQNSTDATLTGWTTSLSAGDVLAFNLDSIATISRVTLQITLQRT